AATRNLRPPLESSILRSGLRSGSEASSWRGWRYAATDQVPEANEVTMTADHAKAIADYFAKMFDEESANTLKVLRAVPNDRRDYKPDEKSRTAWELATHLAGSGLRVLCDG